MAKEIPEAKAALRNQIRAALKTILPGARAAASAQICARLRALPVWMNTQSILFFAPQPEEPDLWSLLEEALASGKTVALPRYSTASQAYVAALVRNVQSDIAIGHFQIREPLARCDEVPLNRFDLVLVPGVAFDLRGRRLGRGKGYYDRLLADVRGVKCGVAFDEQIVDAIPVGPLDTQLDIILTPTRWVMAGESPSSKFKA